MRYAVIALLAAALVGCESPEAAEACANGGCTPSVNDPGVRPMSPTASRAGTRPPLDLQAPRAVETATFGMG